MSNSQLGELLAVIGRKPGETVVISSQAAGGGKGLDVAWTTVEECDKVVDSLVGRSVWFGIQPIDEASDRSNGKRGDVSAVIGLDTFYADLDFKTPKKPGGLDPVDAMSVIDELSDLIGTGPSAIVATGHGIQPYWPMAKRLDSVTGALLLLRWRKLIIKVMAPYGAKPDGVFELSRIFRVPGPDNVKNGVGSGLSAATGLSLRSNGSQLVLEALEKALDLHVPEEGLEERTRRAAFDFNASGADLVGECQPVAALEWAGLRAARREDPEEPSAHMSVVGKIMALVTYEVAGHCGATAAIESIRQVFVDTVSDRLSIGDAEDEYDRMVETARSKVFADPRIDNPFASVPEGYVSQARGCCIKVPLDDRKSEPRADPAIQMVKAMEAAALDRADGSSSQSVVGSSSQSVTSGEVGEELEDCFLADEFWESRPVFSHLRSKAWSALQSPEGVLVAAISLTLANVMPNVVLPACVGVEASLNLMTVICGASGDGKSVCRKLAQEALEFVGGEEVWQFNPSSGQGVAGQYQFLHKERGQQPQMRRARYRAMAVVEESDTIAALANNPTSTLSAELRKAAMGESLGFGNVGDTQTNLPEHTYRFVLMMCMQPELAGWLLGNAAGGLPQRFIWACVRDPRVVRGVARPGAFRVRLPREALPSPIPVRNEQGQVDVAASEKDDNGKVNVFAQGFGGMRSKYVMGISDKVCQEIVEAAIQRKLRGDDAGGQFDGHAILARLKVAAGLSLMDERVDISDEDWDLAAEVVAVSNATRAWVQGKVSDQSIKANVAASRAKAHGRMVEESIIERETRARVSKKILTWLTNAGDAGLTKFKMRDKLQASERDLIDRGNNSVLDGLLDAGLVRYEDIQYRGKAGSRWFRVA